MTYHVIGGAGDLEMTRIHTLALKAGWTWHQATADLGEPVHGGNAYRCDPVEIPAGDTQVWVECSPVGGVPKGAIVIDHHKPGDPGYGVPAAEFLRGSSIGQFISLLAQELGYVPGLEVTFVATNSGGYCLGDLSYGTLRKYDGWVVNTCYSTGMPWFAIIPPDLIIAAAADHCLAAAYRGECPGVSYEALAAWRAETKAEFQGRSVSDIIADVGSAKGVLLAAPEMSDIPGCRDLRRNGFVPELPEAACQLGFAFLTFIAELSNRSGRPKVVIQAATARQLEAFFNIAKAEGWVDCYGGDPARGFAGAYLPEEKL